MPLVDTLTRDLAEAIGEAGRHEVKVVCVENASAAEETLRWYGAKPNPDSEPHIYLGAAVETWDEIGGPPEAILGSYLKRALTDPEREQLAANIASAEPPTQDWPRIGLEFSHSAGGPFGMCCVLSPALNPAVETIPESVANHQPSFALGANAVDMLAHVQVPVRVSFGGTQIRMKELLNLSTGSVVELDQSMNDSVEILVNDCLIARGEVVAVDGHYGVRVLEMVSGKGIRP